MKNTTTNKVNDINAVEVADSNNMTNNVWTSNASESCCRRTSSFCKTGNRSYCIIIAFLVLVIIFLLNIFVYYILKERRPERLKLSNDNVCVSEQCVRAAAAIIDRIDASVDPCTNFYDFACGQFLKKKTVPDDHSNRNILQEMQDDIYIEMKNYFEAPVKADEPQSVKKVKMFYASCMNDSSANDEIRAANALFELINNSGGSWFLFDSAVNNKATKNDGDYHIEQRLFSAFMHQIQSIFYFHIAPDKNSTLFQLHLYAGSTILESIYLINATSNESQYSHYKSAYCDLQYKVLAILAAFKGINEDSLNKGVIWSQIADVFRFEADLANFTKQHADNTNDESDLSVEMFDEKSNTTRRPLYQKMTISELEEQFTFTNWTKIIQRMSEQALLPISEVMIDHKDYLLELNALFARYSKQTIDNYLCWAKVAKFLPYLGPRFRRIYADFRREVPDLSQGVDSVGSSRVFLSRWKECVHVTCEGLKLPSSILYLHHNKEYLQTAIARVKSMVKDIKNAFYILVDKQSWLNNTAIKQRMKERAGEIHSKVAFPDFVNSSESDKMYQNFKVDTKQVFVKNIIKMAEYEMILELRKLNQSLDTDKEWLFHPLISNAFADSTNKFIILPVGILRHPLLSFKRPVYLDYATLGVVIGHEIAHSFYNELKKEISGDPSWWTPDMNSEYERRTQCFISQFSSYKIEEIGENVSGNQTLEENICDFAGLQQAYTAYQSNKTDTEVVLPGLTEYTPDQLFFIQYAQIWCEIANEDGHRKSLHDSHAPGKYRANGVMVNTEQYASAFSCKLNSAMNPENKCKLWSAV